jgi:MoaA/NifB/PqqE/SkfB family radical SAM enzyme
MIAAPQFDSLVDMDTSSWLQNIKSTFEQDILPRECHRCQQTENINNSSIRLNALAFDQQQSKADYLTVGGVLDNVCNSACFTCDAELSTKIGSLYANTYPIVDNADRFWKLPQEKIVHLDINGGEPAYSKNYKTLLKNLPPNLKTLRLNTNCSTVLTELLDIVQQGIKVTVTVSCDGIGDVHELVRWPILWKDFYNNLMVYKTMPVLLNLWTTVSVLNVDDLPNIQAFAKQHEIDHSYAYLKYPQELAVDNNDLLSRQAYISKQKQLRGIL